MVIEYMQGKIVLFTANTMGGIIQFTVQVYHTLIELDYSVVIYCPNEARKAIANEVASADIQTYKKVKSVIRKQPYREISSRIEREYPEYVWFCDDSVICAEVGLHIKKDVKIKQMLTMHDAGGYHPTNRLNLRTRVLRHYSEMIDRLFFKRLHRFVLLSSESEKVFKERYPAEDSKVVRVNLGAHIPRTKEVMPSEITCLNGGKYLMFFGRIDKYKGIGSLLHAYLKCEDIALPLVIAGSGVLTADEKTLYEHSKKVILINRFITDGEMKWLFANCHAVFLPYIEATQSGVIPIAYSYEKPVIVSDLPGLKQFVEDGKTGSICSSNVDWENTIIQYSQRDTGEMQRQIRQYYESNMNWNDNIGKMFAEL